MTALAFNPILHDQPDSPVDIGWETDVFSSQPQYAAQIDWSNPICRGLRLAWLPTAPRYNAVLNEYANATNGTLVSQAGSKSVMQISGAYGFPSSFSLSNGATFFSVWGARRSGNYFSSDGQRFVFSTRNDSNQGFSFGRDGAVGGAPSNLTRLCLAFQGVQVYSEANYTIPGHLNVPVCVRYNATANTISWRTFGVQSSPDTTVGVASSGGPIVVNAQGPITSPGVSWLDETAIILAWNRALSDAEIKSISTNPWQIFKKRRLKASTAASIPKVNFLRNLQRTTQPQHPTQVDWSNPITRGLVRCVSSGGLEWDSADSRRASRFGNVSRTPRGYSFGSASSIDFRDAPLLRYTVFALAYAYSAPGIEPRVVCRTGSDGNYDQNYCLNLNEGFTPRAGHKQVANNAYQYIRSSISVASGSLCGLASTYDGAFIRVYTNGSIGGAIAASDPQINFSGPLTSVGASDGSSRVVTYGGPGILLAAIWSRALSDAEIKSISANPWQIFV